MLLKGFTLILNVKDDIFQHDVILILFIEIMIQL